MVLDSTQKKVVTTFGRLPKIIHILTASHTVEKEYNRYAIQNKIITIDNWVSPALIEIPRVNRNEQLSSPVRVGLVGHIFHAKGQWTTLESLMLAKNVFPLQLLIYGDPLPEEAEKWENFQETVKELIRIGWDIQFLGYQQSKIKIFDNLDILVIPTLLSEAFGLTAIEAMAREVVVISNRSGALADIIHNKVNGFFYNSKCFDELIPILQDLLDQTYDISDIRHQGLETVRQHYHPTKQMERLHSLLAEGVLKEVETAVQLLD
ncbi:MAG: glycosyltransferase family 4 protein [Planctomycetota bacterium]|jgi:glycosyltransferase involved in cell wall biosynthesis